MKKTIEKSRLNYVLGLAIAMTTAVEFIYFVVWGIFLFPEGNLTSKLVWTSASGLGMGAVIGAGVLILVEGRSSESLAFWGAALIMAAVGIACAFLCGQIDMTFNYFGGRDEPLSFLLSGVGPAIIGGLVFGWLLRIHSAKTREIRLLAR